MSNTIELPERIGQDAPLRHGSRESRAQTLDALNASEGSRVAAASGDKRRLEEELGHTQQPVRVNHDDGGGDPCEGASESEPKHDRNAGEKKHPPSGR